MVQIKKKVTLKIKTEQEPEVEVIQQPAARPTLRKKEPTSNPEPSTPKQPIGEPQNEKGGKSKLIGGIAAIALVGLLGYGAYTLLPSSDNNSSSTTTEQVKNGTIVDVNEDTKTTDNQSETETTDNDNSDSGTVTAGETTNTPSNEETPNVQTTKPEQDMTAKSTNVKTNASKPSTNEPVNLSGTLEQTAKDVIRGNFGNGEVRKQKLGDQYSEIQNKVNEMYRNGLVK